MLDLIYRAQVGGGYACDGSGGRREDAIWHVPVVQGVGGVSPDRFAVLLRELEGRGLIGPASGSYRSITEAGCDLARQRLIDRQRPGALLEPVKLLPPVRVPRELLRSDRDDRSSRGRGPGRPVRLRQRAGPCGQLGVRERLKAQQSFRVPFAVAASLPRTASQAFGRHSPEEPLRYVGRWGEAYSEASLTPFHHRLLLGALRLAQAGCLTEHGIACSVNSLLLAAEGKGSRELPVARKQVLPASWSSWSPTPATPPTMSRATRASPISPSGASSRSR